MKNYTHHLDENSSASPVHSPGVVRDDEFLLRLMFNPQHVENGKLTPAAVTASDLHTKGFSVYRLGYVSIEFIVAKEENTLRKERKDNVTWTTEGVAKLSASSVRNIKFDEEQAFVIIDTAKENEEGHAEILVARPEKGISHVKEMRKLLRPLLEERMPIEKAFESV